MLYALCYLWYCTFCFSPITAKIFIHGCSFLFAWLMTVRENVNLYRGKSSYRKGEFIAKIDTTTTKLTDKQKEHLGAMNEMKEESTPEAKKKKHGKK